MSLGVTNELVGDLLDCIKSVAAEGDSGSFDFLVLDSFLFSVFISHRVYSQIIMNNQINKILISFGLSSL